MAENGWRVQRVNNGAPAKDTAHYANGAAECWFEGRTMSKRQRIILTISDRRNSLTATPHRDFTAVLCQTARRATLKFAISPPRSQPGPVASGQNGCWPFRALRGKVAPQCQSRHRSRRSSRDS